MQGTLFGTSPALVVVDLTTGRQRRVLATHPSTQPEQDFLAVVARDARIVWPDGIFATAGHVYVTLGQWNRLPSFNGGKDLREPPYLLMRAPLEATDPVDATLTKK